MRHGRRGDRQRHGDLRLRRPEQRRHRILRSEKQPPHQEHPRPRYRRIRRYGAVRFDGGGSTTLYVAGATPSGVVNHPSDNGASESPTHAGARAVSGGFFVFAPPYNHPPRFTTAPVVDAQAGAPYQYDADALDLDVDDRLTFRLDEAPAGATVDADGVVRLVPTADGPPALRVALTVADDRGGAATQTFTIRVAGASGSPVVGDGGMPAPPPDGGAATTYAGAGCGLVGRAGSPGPLGLGLGLGLGLELGLAVAVAVAVAVALSRGRGRRARAIARAESAASQANPRNQGAFTA
jgi:hypothetical protein